MFLAALSHLKNKHHRIPVPRQVFGVHKTAIFNSSGYILRDTVAITEQIKLIAE